MKYASLLSDLNTLSICSPEAAQRLVSVHKTTDENSNTPHDAHVRTSTDNDEKDENLKRVDDLVDLHYNVKINHLKNRLDPELQLARKDVSQILRELSH